MTVGTAAQIELDDAHFEVLSRLTRKVCGIMLGAEKRLMVQSRLRPRLRAVNMSSFGDYIEHVSSAAGQSELRMMISALTTNVTQFFREPHHFELLRTELLPRLKDKLERGGKVRIWSAGCSYGQEPYSIAMHMLDTDKCWATGDFRILATDIDPKALSHARRGIYDESQLASVDFMNVQPFFTSVEDDSDSVEVSEEVKRLITFKELNLLSKWPMQGPFDVIFCRNVVIYFDTETQNGLWPRFYNLLSPEGLFFLGHSERVPNSLELGLMSVGPTAYKKQRLQDATHH